MANILNKWVDATERTNPAQAQEMRDRIARPNSFLGDIGQGLKELPGAAQGLGQMIGKGASLASNFLPPGFKQLAAVGGSVLQGNNMNDHLEAGVGSLIPGVGSIPGLDKIGGFAGGSLGDLMGRVPGIGGIGDAIGGGLKNLTGGGVGDALGSAWDFAKENPDALLAGAQGVLGTMDAAKSRKLRGKALGSAEGAYNERAPLRKMGVEGMASATAPDLSTLFADSANVYKAPPHMKRLGGM